MSDSRHRLVPSVFVSAVLLSCVLYAVSVDASDRPLTGEEIRDLIVGNTVIGPIGARLYDFSFQPDGSVYGAIGVGTDSGSYSVSDDGIYCHEWTLYFDSVRRCYKWYRANRGRHVLRNIDAYRARNIDVWRIEPGLQ